MTQGQLRFDLVAVSPALSLAQHVALFDQLGQNPVGGAFRDPDSGGDVTQADSRIMGHTGKDVGVVGQKVPAGDWRLRALMHISRKRVHEYMISCFH